MAATCPLTCGLEKKSRVRLLVEPRQALWEPFLHGPGQHEVSPGVPSAGQEHEALEVVDEDREELGLGAHLCHQLVAQREEGGEEGRVHLVAQHTG